MVSTLDTVGAVFALNKTGGRQIPEEAVVPGNTSRNNPGIFIVCDGAGRSSAGNVAASLAVTSFYKVFSGRYDQLKSEGDFQDMLTDALRLYKCKVQEFITANPSAKDMGATLALAVIKNRRLYLAWCGNSRIYHIRNGRVLYRVAGQEQEQEKEPKINGRTATAEVRTNPQNSILPGMNGSSKCCHIERRVIDDFSTGDWLLLCSGGLLEQFSEKLFPSVLGTYHPGHDYAATIDQICNGKIKDNYSMYLVNYQKQKKAIKLPVLLALALLILVAAAFAFTRYSGKHEIKPLKDKPDQLIQNQKQEAQSNNEPLPAGIR